VTSGAAQVLAVPARGPGHLSLSLSIALSLSVRPSSLSLALSLSLSLCDQALSLSLSPSLSDLAISLSLSLSLVVTWLSLFLSDLALSLPGRCSRATADCADSRTSATLASSTPWYSFSSSSSSLFLSSLELSDTHVHEP